MTFSGGSDPDVRVAGWMQWVRALWLVGCSGSDPYVPVAGSMLDCSGLNCNTSIDPDCLRMSVG